MRALALTLATALPLAARAHAAGEPAVAWTSWNFAPWLVLLMLLSAGGYALGVRRLWRNAGRGRGITLRQAAAFAAGWLALAVALVSPLDALGGWLFSAHMVQHELLMVIAAPLLVLGRPLAAWAWALPVAAGRAIGRWTGSGPWSVLWAALTDPLAAWALHAVALWGWHIPALFDAALHHEAVHIAQHFSFLATALFFWWAVLGHDPRGRYGPGHSVAYLFTTMLHTAALGALLALASTPWYPAYFAPAAALGADPLQDQQLGGLVMWVPAGFAYVAAALSIIGRMLTRVRA
jgi:putative membrane protein